MICPFLSIGKGNMMECVECYCALYMSDSDTHTYGCAFTTGTLKMEALEDKLDDVVDALTSISR